MRNDLFVASENGDLETIKNLYGQDSRVLSDITLRGDNALHIAAREGHEHIVGWILQVDSLEPALVVARNEDDNTPLHEAAKCSNPDLVKILSDQKRSCASQLNKFGETPLTIACKYGHEQTVKQLLDLEGGATSILHAAVHGGNLEIVKAILNYRAWHNDLMTEKDNYGRCAVHVAARKGRWDIIEQFMSKVRDCVQIRSLDHKSVLHFAVEYNHLEIVRNLLADKKESKKAELVSRDHDLSHNTALHLAAKDGVDSQV
ncbi:ankyrin repeat-containing protein At5g02620-like [Cryptomeria japonica]|uniref:ankyrin repeat-containing protein At5g02620-like n=1 Tax=Cryptomeria japonica TaxID=3369 RepID=UPI0027DA01BC|nr:ankyrin repeat-containing protein At5g02620-like [Cryptomeria japonica]